MLGGYQDFPPNLVTRNAIFRVCNFCKPLGYLCSTDSAESESGIFIEYLLILIEIFKIENFCMFIEKFLRLEIFLSKSIFDFRFSLFYIVLHSQSNFKFDH